MADSTPVTFEKGKLYDLNIADVQPDPKAGRSILVHIAKQKTPEKMAALYSKRWH